MTLLSFLLRERARLLPQARCSPRLFIFSWNKEGRAEASGEEKGKRQEERGDPSCVVLPESSVNSVSRGVALCVVCHGVLRRAETSHANLTAIRSQKKTRELYAHVNKLTERLFRELHSREPPERESGSSRESFSLMVSDIFFRIFVVTLDV